MKPLARWTFKSREELISYVSNGHDVQYTFFWGHQKPASGVSKSCFSQWYESAFTDGAQRYLTAEHYMMAKKAELFGDSITKDRILACNTPDQAKKLGRTVAGFNDEVWANHRFDIVISANLAKFSQNPTLKNFLLGTGDRVLVEASPVDNIWGIGLAEDDPAASEPARWKGLNLLGFALMCVRDQLSR